MNKLAIAYKIGGIPYILKKISDRFLKTDKCRQYIEYIQKEAKPSQYENVLKKLFLYELGKELNLEVPRTFNEKIQWLKINEANPIKTILADKYLVRNWVKDKIGQEHLIPLIGAYNSFEEVDYDSLPKSFVIKANHGSGMNIIVKDKETVDFSEIREKCNNWLSTNFAFQCGLELQYKDIKPKLVIEKYMVEESGSELKDYKLFCFNGEPKFIVVDVGRFGNHFRNIYSNKWELLPFKIDYDNDPSYIMECPKNLEGLLEIAKKLSSGFAFVRVDLYLIDDNVFFGEMTFSPRSGYALFFGNDELDRQMGDWINLPSN